MYIRLCPTKRCLGPLLPPSGLRQVLTHRQSFLSERADQPALRLAILSHATYPSMLHMPHSSINKWKTFLAVWIVS